MSVNYSDQRPLEDFDEAFEAAMQRLRQKGANEVSTEEIAALQQGRKSEGSKMGSLSEVAVEFVRNPDRGASFDLRHNQLLITRALIEALLSKDDDRMQEMENQVAQSGGFLMTYDGEGKQRLENAYNFDRPKEGGWLMAETSAVPLGRDGQPLQEGRVLGADGQFLIPADNNDDVPKDFPLLGEHDYVLDGETISQDVKARPSSAMLIGDIAALREYSRYGFAAVTEDAAFTRLIHEINTQRENKIQYILAAIAGVKGIMNNKGELLHTALEPGIRNWRSLNLHMNRRSAPGFLHGKQRDRRVDVELPAGDMGQLIVDWYVTVQRVSKIVPNIEIHIVDEKNTRTGGSL